MWKISFFNGSEKQWRIGCYFGNHTAGIVSRNAIMMRAIAVPIAEQIAHRSKNFAEAIRLKGEWLQTRSMKMKDHYVWFDDIFLEITNKTNRAKLFQQLRRSEPHSPKPTSERMCWLGYMQGLLDALQWLQIEGYEIHKVTPRVKKEVEK